MMDRGPTLPPAVAAWFEMVEERASTLAPKQKDAVRRFVQASQVGLVQLAVWLDAGGGPSYEVAESAQQLSNSAAALARHATTKRPKRGGAAGAPEAVARHDVERSDQDVVLEAVQRAAKRDRPGTLLFVGDVRRLANLPKARFDAAALDLSRVRLVVLHHHDHPRLVEESEREQFVHDPERDVFYIGIAPRAPR